MLYKIKDNDDKTMLVPLKQTSMHEQGILEKKMEQWLADNPNVVLPEGEEKALVIFQEKPFGNVPDAIAVDENGNLVIIEVKRGQTPRDVIAQAMEYAAIVAGWDEETLNQKAMKYFTEQKENYESLRSALAKSGIDTDEATFKFNERQRIFIVGEKIDEKTKRTACWLNTRDVSITCLSYTCYLSGEPEREFFLDFQEVVRPLDRQGGDLQTTMPSSPRTEEEASEGLPDGLREIYLDLKKRVESFGADVQFGATKSSLIFKSSLNFAEIQSRSREGCLVVYVRQKGFSIAQNESGDVHGVSVTRVPDSHGWTLSHWFKVNHESDLDAVTTLLRQSYDAVKG